MTKKREILLDQDNDMSVIAFDAASDDDTIHDDLTEVENFVYSHILEYIVEYGDIVGNKTQIIEEHANDNTKKVTCEDSSGKLGHIEGAEDENITDLKDDAKADLIEDLSCRGCDYEDDDPRNVSSHKKNVHKVNDY